MKTRTSISQWPLLTTLFVIILFASCKTDAPPPSGPVEDDKKNVKIYSASMSGRGTIEDFIVDDTCPATSCSTAVSVVLNAGTGKSNLIVNMDDDSANTYCLGFKFSNQDDSLITWRTITTKADCDSRKGDNHYSLTLSATPTKDSTGTIYLNTCTTCNASCATGANTYNVTFKCS